MSDNDIVGRLMALNGKNLSGVQVDGVWYNCKPTLLEAALGNGLKVGDTIKLSMKGATKEFINIMRLADEALKAQANNEDSTVKVLGADGSLLYTTEAKKEPSRDESIIRQVAAKCATEVLSANGLSNSLMAKTEWVGWAEHINKWIRDA
jgi:hypothetical protein